MRAVSARADPDPDPDSPAQISLRLFAAVERYRGVPPDRALWREAIRQALGARTVVEAGGRRLGRATLIGLAWSLYARADRAGRIADRTHLALAADLGTTERTVQSGLRWLGARGLISARRPSRRAAMVYALNLGGLDWPTIRARIAAHQQARKHQHSSASTSPESGHGVRTESGHEVRTIGLPGRDVHRHRHRPAAIGTEAPTRAATMAAPQGVTR